MSVANPPNANHASSSHEDDFCVVIFAKAPVAGRCKTRLARGVGSRRAAHIYRAMLEHAVAETRAATCGRVLLACAPDTRHPFLRHLARRYAVTCHRQARGDLGTRMARGIALGRRYARCVILIGSDQPALAGAWLHEARRALAHDGPRAWLAPTRDGGYWGIGLNRPRPQIFRGPRWSTPRVAIATRTELARQGFAVSEAPVRNDIDEPRDWHRLSIGLRRHLARRACLSGTTAFEPT